MDLSYVPIQTLDLNPSSKLTFDLYVNLPLNQKYILYRRAGATIEESRFEKLTQANYSQFFIRREEYKEFVKYVASRIQKLVESSDHHESRQLMVGAARSLLTSTFNQDDPAMTQAFMGNLTDISLVIIDQVIQVSGFYKKKTFFKLAELAEKGSDFQKHPVHVATLAVFLTLGIGYSNERLLADMAMAALLHDVGLSKLSPRVAANAHRSSSLGLADRKELESHPEKALELLAEKGIVLSDPAKNAILQHHEEYNGFGYPKGLRGINLGEMGQVLRIADELDSLLWNNVEPNRSLKEKVAELLGRMQKDRSVDPFLLGRIRQALI